jgi:hypothetical protein
VIKLLLEVINYCITYRNAAIMPLLMMLPLMMPPLAANGTAINYAAVDDDATACR